MTRDQLEFAISQYLDGNLPPLETAALEERLATDAEARALYAGYQTLDATLRHGLPTPSLAWDRLEAQLCDAVAREEAPVRNWSMKSWRRAAGLALAASLAIATGVYFLAQRERGTRTEVVDRGGTAVTNIVVGPQVARQDGPPVVADVSVGSPTALADSWRYSESVITRPSVVLIDRAGAPAQDMGPLPY